MEISIGTIHLQLAMAFGQGAGAMLATPACLDFLLTQQSELVERAATNWNASKPAFAELVRLLGQVSATKAAVAGRAEIDTPDVESSLGTVMSACPCLFLLSER